MSQCKRAEGGDRREAPRPRLGSRESRRLFTWAGALLKKRERKFFGEEKPYRRVEIKGK